MPFKTLKLGEITQGMSIESEEKSSEDEGEKTETEKEG